MEQIGGFRSQFEGGIAGFAQKTVLHDETARHSASQKFIVGDNDDGETKCFVESHKKLMDAAAGFLIEIAGGLVGQQNRGIHHQCTGQGNALLFTTREFAGFV